MLSFNSSQNALPNVSQCLTGLLRNTDQQSFSLFRQWFSRSPREASAAIDAIRRRLTPYFFADGGVSVEKVAEEVARTEFSLAKSHWKLASEVSNQTFFENNYGFSSDELESPAAHFPLLTATTTTSPSVFSHLFLRRNVESPQLSFARGFKTKRATEGRKFLRRSQEFRAASETEGKTAATTSAAAESSPSSSGRAEVSGKTSGRVWDGINKLASILIILAIVVSFLQVFGVTFRVIRGGNEISPQDIDVTFDDVKGCDEAKEELQEIVDFLTNPEKFSVLGGKLPRGCLLVGPPGTGKTLLARAVAGEAGVPFFHAVGSEFDEVLVGQGARRVRDLFKTAKKRAPCVVFIDEIDSVGGKRSSSVLHPYANQTINQLLSEMDGFVINEGVIVLGATNRSEDLDKALLRPGRFDTQVIVAAPDLKGRKEILQHYLAKIKHDASVDVDKLAKMTVGFTGADLENMVNTSAIRAATDGKEWVTMAEFEYSHDKHRMGTDWKSRVRDKEDLKITAFHEAGHTLVAYFTQDADPIHKVTIVAKGMTGGHTAFLPEKDQNLVAKAQYLAMLDVCMGGRAAEELIFGKDRVTGGASQDLRSATSTAEAMVKKLGMSDRMGLRVIPDKDGFGQGPELSTTTTETIDSEVKKLLDESYARAMSILKTHRRELDSLAEALLSYETLDADDVKTIVDGNPKAVARKMTVASNNGVNSIGGKARQGVLPVGQQPPLSGADALA